MHFATPSITSAKHVYVTNTFDFIRLITSEQPSYLLLIVKCKVHGVPILPYECMPTEGTLGNVGQQEGTQCQMRESWEI